MGKIAGIYVAFILIASIFCVFADAKTTNKDYADTIWSFSNFYNNYKLYKSTTCDVAGKKTCRNELSWMGNSITFKFFLTNTDDFTENMNFNFYVEYYTSSWKGEDAVLEIKIGNFKKTITVDSTGDYSVSIPKSYFKAGKNSIKIKGKNIHPGYGHYEPTVVLGYVSLEKIIL